MSNPLSMFMEKNSAGGDDWSMTRVVAFMVAVVVCYALVVMANNDHAHDIGLPFAAIVVVTVLAVPLQALFKMLAEWFRSGPGKALLAKVVESAGAAAAAGVSKISTTTTVNE